MKVSFVKAVYTLLVLLPLSFKIKFTEDIAVYPQELLLPILLLIGFYYNKLNIAWRDTYYIKTFYYLFAALLLILLCSFISLFQFYTISGILKTIKYLLYCQAIFLLTKYDFYSFEKMFVRVGSVTVLLTLSLFFYKFLVSGESIQGFYQRSMWQTDLIPSGFSNTNLNLRTLAFERMGGNHGIYGSYLVLVYLFVLSSLRMAQQHFTFKHVFIILCIVLNLFLLPSRETIIIFIIVNIYLFKSYLSISKVKSNSLIIFTVLIVAVVSYMVFSDTQLVIISKLKYTLESYLKGGQESNISLRFNVWYLTLLSYIIYPIHLIIGYGYNTPNYSYYLTNTNTFFNLNLDFPNVPESFFFLFLAYGGLLAFGLAVVYFLDLILKTYRLRKTSILAGTFFCFTVMLFFTNNTGASMLSDMLFAQYSLVYIYINKINE